MEGYHSEDVKIRTGVVILGRFQALHILMPICLSSQCVSRGAADVRKPTDAALIKVSRIKMLENVWYPGEDRPTEFEGSMPLNLSFQSRVLGFQVRKPEVEGRGEVEVTLLEGFDVIFQFVYSRGD